MQITQLFFQEDSREPFRFCTQCNNPLHDHLEYSVIKHFRKYPWEDHFVCDLEAAICRHCAEKQSEQISYHSMIVLGIYMEKMKIRERIEHWKNEPEQIERACSRCALHDLSVDECEEFQIEAFMQGGNLLTHTGMPLMLSGKATEEIYAALSDETRQMFDDWYGDLFSGPPEFRDLIRPVLV